MVFKRNNARSDMELEEFEWKVWIPENLTTTLIEEAHEAKDRAHGGIRKTLNHLKNKFFWPNMVLQVRSFVGSCQVCKECKSSNQQLMPEIGNEVQTDRPFQKLCIDFLIPSVKEGQCICVGGSRSFNLCS